MESRHKPYTRILHKPDASIATTGRVCEDCDLVRTEREFGQYANCSNCRAQGKPVRRKR